MKRLTWVELVVLGACSAWLLACGSGSKDVDNGGSDAGAGTAKGSGGAHGGSGGKGSADKGSTGTGSGNHGSGGASASGDGGSPNRDAGGGLADEPPFEPTGEPLKADDMKWTWVDFPDTKCRDGSMAGLAVSMNSKSDKLMIFLQGGGACFDQFTCLANAATGNANVDNQKGELTAGVFDRSNAKNPVKDWNFVFIPYCTGDVHLGTKDDGMVDAADGVQHFVGRLNLTAFLNRVVPTFSTASQVLLTGVSAGGFGSAGNTEYVQWAFGKVPVTVIDDSGPAMSTKVVPSCLQKQWRDLWGFDGSILKDCGADCPDRDNFELDYTKHVAEHADGRMAGLISSNADNTITVFFGYGQNNCTGNFATPVSQADFTAGLLEYRDFVKGIYPNYGTYYIQSNKHTWIADDGFYTTTTGANKRLLVDWYADIVNGVKATAEGP
jgi:hypothetical protein